MKKILVVSDVDMKRLDPGTDFYANFLKECFDRNYYVEFILPTEPCALVKEKLKQCNFTYTILQNWWRNTYEGKRNNIKITIPIVRMIITKNIDLVAFNFCSELTALIVAFLTFIFFKKPRIIWHQHSEIRVSGNNKLLNKIKEYISRIRVLSWFIDQVCPVSEALKNQIIKKKVSGNKITILYNGVNLEGFDYKGSINDVIEDIEVSKDTKIIISVANLIKDKGVQYLIRAVDLIKRERYQLKVIIVGEGVYSKEIRTLISQLKIDDIVYLTGKRSDVPNLLCASDFLVLPTLKEALPYVIIEAMAAKKAVIASHVGGIPELIKNNYNGILVPPGDYIELSKAILRLIKNRDEAIKMGLRGREIVEKKFSVDKMVNNYLKVYETYLIRET